MLEEVEAEDALLSRSRDLEVRTAEEPGVPFSPLEDFAELLLEEGPATAPTDVSILSGAEGMVSHPKASLSAE